MQLPSESEESGWFEPRHETHEQAWQRAQAMIARLHAGFRDADQVIAVITYGWFVRI